MDAFFASVEQRDHPEWRGRPVIVGAAPDRRGVVAAASYEARAFGVRSAMPSREAGRRCPQGIFTPPRMARYAAVSRRVFGILRRFTPLVEPVSIDEAFLDVSGARALFGTGPEIAERIRAAIRAETGLTASVGVAPNKFLAKLASDLRKPDGLTVVPTDPERILRFLAPLPAGRLWGVGPRTEAALARAGWTTIGDLQRAAPDRLAGALGARAAADLQALARGEDERPVETDGEEKSVSREHTFETDVREPAVVEACLCELADDVARRLRRLGKRATVAQLKVRWAGFETRTRRRRLARPCNDDFALRAAARDLLRAQPLERPVRLIGFGVHGLDTADAAEPELFPVEDASRTRHERLSQVMDDLRRRYGPDSVKRLPDGGRETKGET